MLTVGLVVWGVIASLLALAFAVGASVRGAGVRRLRVLLDVQAMATAVAVQERDQARREAEAAGLACNLARQLELAEGERNRVLSDVPRGTVRLNGPAAEDP